MRGLRKHIHDACSGQPVTAFLHQKPGIPGQRRRMTGHVHDPPDAVEIQLPEHLDGTGTGRVKQHFAVRLFLPGLHRVILGQVAGEKFGIGDAVAFGIFPGAHDQAGVAFDADHLTGGLRQWQGEITQPAEQVQDHIVGCRAQQLDRPRNHRFVQRGVDLDEIQRPEPVTDAMNGQIEVQRRIILMQRRDRLCAARLQKDLHGMLPFEIRQLRQIGVAQFRQVAEHQSDRSIALDEFDLRNLASGMQGRDQAGQRRDQGRYRRQHGIALFELGHETRIGLPEADQCRVFFLDETNRKPAFAPIMPRLGTQCRQHPLRPDMADALQVVQQGVLLDFNLPVGIQMLQNAARADSEVPALRNNAVCRRFEHLDNLGFIVMPIAAGLQRAHPFTGQCPGNENGFTIQTADAASVMGQAVDGQLEFAFCFFAASCHNGIPSQNAIFADLAPDMGIASASHAAPTTRILLIEDDEISRSFLGEALSAPGCEVTACESFADALRRCALGRFELIVSDIRLEDGSLYEMAACLPAGTPLLATSAQVDGGIRERLTVLGIGALLAKPATVAEIRDAVEGVLAKAVYLRETAVLDEQRALAALGGNTAAMTSLKSLFRLELPDMAGKIQQAFDAGDAVAMHAHLHKLRASCGFLGATRLLETCIALDENPDHAQLDSFLGSVQETLAIL